MKSASCIPLHRQPRRTGTAGFCHHLPEGAFDHRRHRSHPAGSRPHTRIVTAVNGFLTGTSTSTATSARDRHLKSIDPGRTQWRELARSAPSLHRVSRDGDRGARRHPPYLWRPLSSRRSLRRKSTDVERLAALFVKAGLQAPPCSIGSVTKSGSNCGAMSVFNPISALTHATLDKICTDPATRALSKAMMLETQSIAETFG